MGTLLNQRFDKSQVDGHGADEILAALQLEQFQHDEKYHREISRLAIQDRLKHMALHFAKYAGYFIEALGDDVRIKRVVTDTAIIALSTANILNLDLREHLADIETLRSSKSLLVLGGRLGEASSGLYNDPEMLLFRTSPVAGRMAGACEKLDHLEDFPYRKVIAESVVEMLELMMTYAARRDWRLEELVRERLSGVKEKSIFHGRI